MAASDIMCVYALTPAHPKILHKHISCKNFAKLKYFYSVKSSSLEKCVFFAPTWSLKSASNPFNIKGTSADGLNSLSDGTLSFIFYSHKSVTFKCFHIAGFFPLTF